MGGDTFEGRGFDDFSGERSEVNAFMKLGFLHNRTLDTDISRFSLLLPPHARLVV